MPFSNLANILRGATHANLLNSTVSATPAQTAAITTGPQTVTAARPADDSTAAATKTPPQSGTSGPTDKEIAKRKTALAVLAVGAVGLLYYYQYRKTPALPAHHHAKK